MPVPLSAAEALDRRAAKEKELADADPAIAPSIDPWAIPPPSEELGMEEPPSAGSRAKGRSRQPHMNGNGDVDSDSASAPLSRPRVRDSTGRYVPSAEPKPSSNKPASSSRRAPVGTRPSSSRIRERASRASEGGHTPSADSPSSTNGTPSRGGMGPPAPPRPSSSLSNRGTPRGDDGRSASGYGGHPNGFMEMFGGGGRSIADAPGRTIYSAQRATQSNR